MLKSYKELREIDVTPYTKLRDKDEKSRYLPWAACVDLLHQSGAEKVYWTPLQNENGSSLFMSNEAFADKQGIVNRCYEVRIEITVDDDVFVYSYPLVNGILPVKDNSLNQNVVYKAMARAFVKAIAIRYGLGFSLWANDEIEQTEEENLNVHNLFKIKQRYQEEYTRLLRKKMSTSDIANALGRTEEEIKALFSYFDILDRFEKDMQKL